MPQPRLNGHFQQQAGEIPPAKRSRNRRRSKKPMTHNAPQNIPHVPVPSWVWAIIVNVIVIAATAGVSYGILQGDMNSLKQAVSAQSTAMASQSMRIDGFAKEQDRITRLEENLKYITSLLSEIRDDLRAGRYATPPSRVGP